MTADTVAQFEAIRRDERALSPVVAVVAGRCGFAIDDATRFPDGSLPVYAIGEDRVLKLYPRCYGEDASTERAALELVEGRLPIPTPRVRACGEVEGWQYIVMDRLRGRSLAASWDEIPRSQRSGLFGVLGETLRTLHGISASGTSIPEPDWPTFVSAQRASARERQRARGLNVLWLEQIDDFLDATPTPTPLGATARSLLHTEIMREHLLVERVEDNWRLSGLFDFEPAMVGASEYELASAGVFASCGDALSFRDMLLAYGYRADELGPALARRCLAYALLHRFSNLAWYLERVPPPPHVVTLDGLAATWFGCSPAS